MSDGEELMPFITTFCDGREYYVKVKVRSVADLHAAHDKVLAAFAPSPSPKPEKTPEVRALAWVKHPTAELWRADTMLGRYQAYAVVSPASWAFDGYDGITRASDDNLASLEAAKDAAFADYRARILSAIQTSPEAGR